MNRTHPCPHPATRRVAFAGAGPNRALALLCGLLVCGAVVAGDLPDPTAPPGGAVAAEVMPERTSGRVPVLSMVRIAPRQRLALIDGHLVEEGDEVDGHTVRQIDRRGVTLERDGELLELALFRKPGSAQNSAADGTPVSARSTDRTAKGQKAESKKAELSSPQAAGQPPAVKETRK